MIPTADAPTIIPSPATPAAGWSEANASAPPPAAAATGWSEATAVIGGAAPWVEQLPFRNRTHPRSFGTGAFGVDRYDMGINDHYNHSAEHDYYWCSCDGNHDGICYQSRC